MPSGGYREPSNPAPVSNPGAGSARTDGGPVHMAEALSSGKYGETQDAGSIAASAPAVSAGHAGNLALAGALQGQPTFGDASQAPGVPVTAGAQYGPGAGPEALGANDPVKAEAMRLAKDGTLAALIVTSQQDGVSQDFKNYVRTLIASIA